MDNVKNDIYFAKRILKNIEVLSHYLKDKSQDDLLNDGFLCDAIENRFTKLSEDASKLSNPFKESLRQSHGRRSIRFAIGFATITMS